MLDKEAKNHKEKESLQHLDQPPACSKQNHRTEPVINNFQENDNPFGNRKQYQEIVIIMMS